MTKTNKREKTFDTMVSTKKLSYRKELSHVYHNRRNEISPEIMLICIKNLNIEKYRKLVFNMKSCINRGIPKKY